MHLLTVTQNSESPEPSVRESSAEVTHVILKTRQNTEIWFRHKRHVINVTRQKTMAVPVTESSWGVKQQRAEKQSIKTR